MADIYSQATVHPFLPLDDVALTIIGLAGPFNDGPLLEKDFTTPEMYQSVLKGLQEMDWVHEEEGDWMFNDDVDFSISVEEDDGLHYLFFEESLGEDGFAFLKWVLNRLPKDKFQYITVEWANFCSKMRPGEFGGGAWFYNREVEEWINTGSWLYDQIKKHQEA